MEKEKVALVAGSTGLVGKELIEILLKSPNYKKVISFVRRSSGLKHKKLEERVISFDSMKLLPHEEVDDVFCCLGTTIKIAKTREAFKKVDFDYPIQLAKLGKEHGATQYLIISAMGANSNSRFFYSRVKGDVEEALKAMHFSLLHIFRPSLLLGEREEFRLGEKAGELFSRVIRPVMVGKLRKYQSIAGKQVAYGMYQAANQPAQMGISIYESDHIQQF
ncbi:oxidoreductase [Rossellomorea aquimaris]|uniref:oxidoreductase n=1 Tax=Rossellomorea aquimaris TaxID=189382 RepID=UPI0007D05201|nr:oxidoreductase [Rossellomorea aquimaris]